ncbi:MAG TPA: S-layer homology domain-containing protein, partial [Chroococcidiopsis sp.]
NGLHYVRPLLFQTVLADYFDDAAEVPTYAQAAIASATLSGLVVNYPDVRQLRPNAEITRAEVVALLCQVFERDRSPAMVPRQYVPWTAQLDQIEGEMTIPLSWLRGNPRMVKQIQTHLYALRLHPGEEAINGRYTPTTEAAIAEFSRVLELPNRQARVLDMALAQALLTTEPVCFVLQQARNREAIYAEYLAQEKGFNSAHLAFLDKGVEGSPFEKIIPNYPAYLLQTEKPALATTEAAASPSAIAASTGQMNPAVPNSLTSTASPANPTSPVNAASPVSSSSPIPNIAIPNSPIPNIAIPTSPIPNIAIALPHPYPKRGELPTIDSQGLAFLHPDIQQACVCIGQFDENRQLNTRWLGKEALTNVELWSATKIIPLMNVVSKVNSRFAQADIDNEFVRAGRSGRGYRFYDLAVDIVNYGNAVGSSNSLAAMFKQFDTAQNLENWVKGITGNQSLIFRGRYGEGVFMAAPQIWDDKLQQVVLTAAGGGSGGSNTISTYDLTRLVTMLAWHPHLPTEARLPGGQWHSLESLVRAMGKDSARYVDVAIARLGLEEVIASPVVISKLGFGRSGARNRTELVYTAFVQFYDTHRCQSGSTGSAATSSAATSSAATSLATTEPPQNRRVLRTLGMTLVGAKKLGNGDREATEIDARMAAEVTEILRRVVLDEL